MNTNINKRGLLVAAMALMATLSMAAPTFAQRQTPPTPVPPKTLRTPAASSSEEDRRVIEGDQTVSGSSFTLASNETLQGDLSVFGGSATTEEGSRIEGDVTLFGGSIEIAGTVTGDVNLFGGSAHLRKGAVVEGEMTTMGGSIQKDTGAVARKGTSEFNGPLPALPAILRGDDTGTTDTTGPLPWWKRGRWNVDFQPWGNQSLLAELSGMILATLLAIVVISLIPKNIARTIDTARSQLVTAGAVGGLSYVAVPVCTGLMAITICLIPGAIVLAVVWAVGIFVGWTAVARVLGERLMIGFGKRDWTLVGQTAAGAFVLALLGSLPLVGWLIGLLASSVGLGALILTRFGTQRYPPTGLQIYTPTSQGPVSL